MYHKHITGHQNYLEQYEGKKLFKYERNNRHLANI